MEDRLFDAPIPGQSLTTEPKNAPWENPSEISTVEDATKMYIGRLAKQEVIDDMVAMAEANVPLRPIVKGIVSQGVMRGMHTVDTGMLVEPIITEFLKQAIESYGVTVRTEPGDPAKKAKEAEMTRFRMAAMRYLEEEGMDEADEGKQLLQDIAMADEAPAEEEAPMEEEAPQGLMAKGQ